MLTPFYKNYRGESKRQSAILLQRYQEAGEQAVQRGSLMETSEHC